LLSETGLVTPHAECNKANKNVILVLIRALAFCTAAVSANKRKTAKRVDEHHTGLNFILNDISQIHSQGRP